MTGSTVTFVKEIVAAAGGATAVARALDISRGSVNEWVKKGHVPNPRVRPLAELTGWKYTPHMIAPELYPNATDGIT
ncbi:YdaS family helix-turn-helix protein [Burkholderia gladioli]|uniref:YdaS family helix-turn-helix protein n=1 Tax=Burkholderia gladioli TaxID=28095 RepID=UPI001ABB7204